jgi:hypothetical protein
MSFPGFVPDIAGPPFRRVAVFLGLCSPERLRAFSVRERPSLPQDLVQLNASDLKILKDSPVYGGSP